MDIKQELRSIVEWEGKLKGRRSAEDMLAFAKATLARIEELEKARELLERGSREFALALAQQRGTIAALQERCRDYARHSD
jgi:hypothetical protein